MNNNLNSNKFAKIENTSFIRDLSSKAILETNMVKVEEYKSKRRLARATMGNASRLGLLEKKVDGIESLLNKILEKLERN